MNWHLMVSIRDFFCDYDADVIVCYCIVLKLHLQMEYYAAWNLAEQQQQALQDEQDEFYRAWDMAEKLEEMYRSWDVAEEMLSEEQVYHCWELAEKFVKKTESATKKLKKEEEKKQRKKKRKSS